MSPARNTRFLNLILLLIVNLLWAAQYPAYKVASDHMNASTLNFWTLLLAILFLTPLLLASKGHRPVRSRKRGIRDFLLMGLLGIVPPTVFMAWGIAHSTASNASILALTIPVLMVFLGVLMLGERITVLRVVSLGLGLAGTVLISRTELAGGSFEKRMLLGNLAVFLAGMGSAFYNTYSKDLLYRYSELEVLTYSYSVGCAGCAVLSLFSDVHPFYLFRGYPLRAWVAVFVLGAFSWGIAMVLWMWVLKRLDVGQVSVSIYLLPVFGLILSAVTLHERPTMAQVLGGGLVLTGTFLTSEYESRHAQGTADRVRPGRGDGTQ